MAMKLYSFPGDFRALKAILAAKYNNIELETPAFEMGKDNLKPEFLAKNPLGKVPLLETSSGCIFESNAIARYIARIRRDTDLTGATFFEQGQVDAWVDFCSHELEVPASLWVYPVFGYADFNAAVHAQAVQNLHNGLAVLNKHLEKNTFLVGHRVTLADLVVACALLYPMKMVLSPEHRAPYPAVTRWFLTVANQPLVKACFGDVPLCETELTAKGNKSKGGSKLPGAGDKKGKGKDKKAKGGDKKKEAKKEAPKKAAAPAPAPAPAPKKMGGPFDHLPKPKVSMDAFKGFYSNAPMDAEGNRDYYAAINSEEMWTKYFNKDDFSIWFCDYNYNSENTKDFMTSNLVGGFIQRSDGVRKGAFGMMHILGDKAPYEITGCWMFRGDSVQPMLEANPDAEYYTWTKANTDDPEVRKRIANFWCDYEKVDGKVITDSKSFK
jgi:elongation factor 1-gamma